MTEINLTCEFEARVWAKEFMRLYGENLMKGNVLWVDESLMLAWFANALMAGYDEANRRAYRQSRGLSEEELGKKIYSQLLNWCTYTVIDEQDACIVINPDQASKIAKALSGKLRVEGEQPFTLHTRKINALQSRLDEAGRLLRRVKWFIENDNKEGDIHEWFTDYEQFTGRGEDEA